MEVSFPVDYDSFNTYTDETRLLFREMDDKVFVTIQDGDMIHRQVRISKEELKKFLRILD